MGLHERLHMNGRHTERAATFTRRPFDFKAGALLRGIVGLVALVLLLMSIGLGLGLSYGAFQAAAAIATRWLTL